MPYHYGKKGDNPMPDPPSSMAAHALIIARRMKEEKTGKSASSYWNAKRALARSLIKAMRDGDEEGVARAFDQFDNLRKQ